MTYRFPPTFRKCGLLALALAMPLLTPAASLGGHDDHDDRGPRERDARYDRYDRDDHFDLRIRIGDRPPPPRVEERRVRVWVPPVYRTVSDRRWVEPVYD